tara:strand:- start:198 stop:506 length:309 start_codon:yes stop_codon:yes gene_type:complete
MVVVVEYNKNKILLILVRKKISKLFRLKSAVVLKKALFPYNRAQFFQFFFRNQETSSKSSLLFKDTSSYLKKKKNFFCQKCFFEKNKGGAGDQVLKKSKILG